MSTYYEYLCGGEHSTFHNCLVIKLRLIKPCRFHQKSSAAGEEHFMSEL